VEPLPDPDVWAVAAPVGLREIAAAEAALDAEVEGEGPAGAALIEAEAVGVPEAALLAPFEAASAVLGGAVLTNRATRATPAMVPSCAARQVKVEMRRRP
jgi:hypothetical protein